jgi:amidohydrolase
VLGAVLALHEAAASLPLPVRWRALFQPAEETGKGALELMGEGALEGASAALSIHMDPSRAAGRVGYRYGVLTAACDELTLTVEGRGGHAARPHESLDPIAASAQLITSLYLGVPRSTESHDPVVVTIGQITAGDNANVIPARAVLRGTLRTLSPATRERTKQQIGQIARGIAEATGTRVTLEFEPGPPSVRNDAGLTDLLRTAAAEVLGTGNLELIERPSMGGEDFAYYLEQVPGAMIRLGCAPPGEKAAPLHSPLFDLDERALAVGARVLARAAVLWTLGAE